MSDEQNQTDRVLRIVLTPTELCEIVAKRTGKPVTMASHWIVASIEMPADLPPLGIAVVATRR
jgi:hypothetical protein